MVADLAGHHTRSQGPPPVYTEMAADNSPPSHECTDKPGEQSTLIRLHHFHFHFHKAPAMPTKVILRPDEQEVYRLQ